MKKRRFTIGVVLLGCVLAGVGFAYQRGKIPDYRVIRADAARRKVDKRVIEADNRFAIKLFKEAVKLSPGKNVVISPPSISMALSMAYNGAAGDTRTAMEKVLEFTGLDADVINSSNSALMTLFTRPDRGVSMSMANSLWMADPKAIVPSYTDLMTSTYRADVGPLDLNAINDWTKRKTHGRIEKAMDNLSDGAFAVLLNTIYFKGAWSHPFPQEDTHNGEFTLGNGEKVTVPMMKSTDLYAWSWDKKLRAVRLPYGGGKLSMYLFVPTEPYSLASFCRDLDVRRLAAVIDDLQYLSKPSDSEEDAWRMQEIVVHVPRFKVAYSALLNENLESLGMGVAFTPGEADFSKMCKERVWILRAIHKAVVDVDEKGTVGSAVSVVEMGFGGGPTAVVVDRPFLFLIRDDKTGLILFMGAVEDPRG